jgi:uncharacterized repeat protein (TIGR01451 family)
VVNATTWEETVTLNSDGTVPDSTVTPPLPAGSDYVFIASYSGDGNYHSSISGFEPLIIRPGSSTTATTILDATTGSPPTGIAGESVLDTATVTGSPAAFPPTGTVIYIFTGPQLAGLIVPAGWDQAGQTSLTTWTQTVTLSGGLVPDSAATPALPAGSYQFLASYSGDGNYAGSLSAPEPLTIGPRSPMLITVPSETVVELGDAPPPLLSDTAVLSGGLNPTGSITFELFQGGTLVHEEMVSVRGNGSYTTPMGFQLPSGGTVAGNYQWVASYSGDGSNNPVFRDTSAGNERVTVIDPTPTLVTTASPTMVTLGPNGATLTDTATLSGGFFPTGDIVFELFFNSGSELVFSRAVTVNSNGDYTTSFTLPSTGPAGTYQWVAVYGGDPNNNEVATALGDEPVTVSEKADLSVVKQFDAAQVAFGFNVAFTLTVHNNGPSAATGVAVTDRLPPGLLFISAAGPGRYDPASGVWTVGTLLPGATAVLQVVVQVVEVGPIVNTAIVGGRQFDPDLSNNKSEAVVVGLAPAFMISKRALISTAFSSAPDPADTLFVAHLYRDVLSREADPQGLDAWVPFLAVGGSRLQVALAIEGSHEHHADEVNAAFLRLLHRPADPVGLDGFTAFLDKGGTLQQVEALIAGSPEYVQDRGGSTAAGFLNALYGDALGRSIDASGLAGWGQLLSQGASPPEVALDILCSLEADQRFVVGLYTQFLHRAADAPGLAGWVNALQQGASDDQVAAAFLSSDEYFALP